MDVDFPLDGLDMSKYVMGNTDDDSMIYDCYAVSNHFGNMGFGHYTAFAKNPLDDKWYEFDDSSVTPIKQSNLEETIITGAAYNIFYRRRDWHEKNKKEGIDFDTMAIKPDMDLVNKK
jgi:ubiquitin carboxyl-terminal hydrolase 4/11/15